MGQGKNDAAGQRPRSLLPHLLPVTPPSSPPLAGTQEPRHSKCARTVGIGGHKARDVVAADGERGGVTRRLHQPQQHPQQRGVVVQQPLRVLLPKHVVSVQRAPAQLPRQQLALVALKRRQRLHAARQLVPKLTKQLGDVRVIPVLRGRGGQGGGRGATRAGGCPRGGCTTGSCPGRLPYTWVGGRRAASPPTQPPPMDPDTQSLVQNPPPPPLTCSLRTPMTRGKPLFRMANSRLAGPWASRFLRASSAARTSFSLVARRAASTSPPTVAAEQATACFVSMTRAGPGRERGGGLFGSPAHVQPMHCSFV